MGVLAELCSRNRALGRLVRPINYRRFRRVRAGNNYYGVFADFAAAEAFIAGLGTRSGYDHDAPAQLYRDLIGKLTPCMYPLMFWLSRIIAQSASQRLTLLDYGGHFGIKFYTFMSVLDAKSRLDWTVYDVPKVVDAGIEFAKTRPEAEGRGLHFVKDTRDRADDIFFSSGALQYVEGPIKEQVAKQGRLPQHVLLGSLPVADCGFVTVQNIGVTVSPYQVFARDAILADMRSLGYVLVDHWHEHSKSCTILSAYERSLKHYEGFYFRLGEKRPDALH